MESQIVEYNDDLELYLEKIGQLFDIPRIINEPQGNPQIINYYLINKLPYRFGNSWEGFMHCGISYDGKHKKGDLKEQARIIERYFHDINAKKVLELAYGLGANSAFLAKRNPEITFEGVDLSNKPLRRYTKIPNLHLQLGDYHDLGAFEDNAYDIAFVIEALCYSTNKLQVLREVKKKLRRGGLFIVIDAYTRDRLIPLSQTEDIMWKLIAKNTAIETFESTSDVEAYMREEYSIIVTKDYSQCVLPSIERWESLTHYYCNHPIFARIANRLIPFDIVKHVMVVLFLPISVRMQVGCYYIHVLKNDK